METLIVSSNKQIPVHTGLHIYPNCNWSTLLMNGGMVYPICPSSGTNTLFIKKIKIKTEPFNT